MIARRSFLVTTASVLAAPQLLLAAEERPIRLFNGKDLAGWYTFLPSKGKNNDPEKIFTVHDGMIHILGKEFGYLCTQQEYENYRLVVEFKWGAKKFPPREHAVRDSGILMHTVGPDKVWPKSIECQIQEGDTGDFWLVDGTSITANGKRQTGGRIVKTRDAEKPTGQWNRVEVICDGDRIVHIVNGVTNNEGTEASVTKGKIAIQSEGAEVFYRRIDLYPLRK